MDKSAEEFQRYLRGIEFPASKEEAASAAESNGAPQHIVQKLRNANRECLDDPVQALQAMEVRRRVRTGATGALTFP